MAFDSLVVAELTWYPLTLGDWAELGVLFTFLYVCLRFLRKTVAGGIFRGPGLLVWILILSFSVLIRALGLSVLDYLFSGAVPIFLVGLIVLFQPEIRHGLARMGEVRLFSRLFTRRRKGADKASEIRAVDEVIAAVTSFSKRKIGALIAIERNVDLTSYLDTGVSIDARIRAELLDTIFSTEPL